MRFTKMQGIGNDYVYVNGFEESVVDPPELARRISDRHFGVGGDGLILIQPPTSPTAHCRMEMYNADGSRGLMCGNGIRCVAKFAHDHGIAPRDVILIDTDAGTKAVQVERGPDGKATGAEVDMGSPILEPSRIPFLGAVGGAGCALCAPLAVAGRTYSITAVSMGNPHAVVRMDSRENNPEAMPLADLELDRIGPPFERHAGFPQRTNTEFIEVRSRTLIEMRVWERGSGETLACGTGACAVLVASVLNGWAEPEAVIRLRGGDLRIRWERPVTARQATDGAAGGSVFLRGPAVEVFSGEWP